MEKLYSLAPYFRVGFKDNVLICGFGSIQSKFKDENLQLIILKALEYIKNPRTLKDIKSFLDKTSQNKNIKKTVFYYLTKKHWLLEDGVYIRDERYSRNFLYYNLSGGRPTKVQTSLANKHVVILGCGGIGNIVGVGLATAGIGKLTLVDQDSIELSNLSRQYMFKELDVDMLKVDILKK
jgi:hypothetical protein